MSERCLICNELRSESTLRCKLCGMGVERRMFMTDSFVFCSQKCIEKFEDIYESSSYEKRIMLLESDVVI